MGWDQTRHFLDPTPRRWRVGETITARHLNEPVDALRRLSHGVQPPRQVMEPAREERVEVRRFVVVEERSDYLVCRRSGGDAAVNTEDQHTYVAKPYLLRQTPFNGLSRNSISYAYTATGERTATDAEDNTESQVIVPSYVVGDEILAARGILGGTGVFGGADSDLALEWVDLNADGRAWAKE